jgi:Glycosyl transferase family 2
MSKHHLTVICHFRNEEVYLPYWLRHHTRLFDHGVLIDYASTDRSRDIIRQFAPSWEVRPSRNSMFESIAIDREVMDIEKEVRGWKMCLNVTEFVMHHDLRLHLEQFEKRHPEAAGMVTTGFIIQDAPDQVGVPLEDRAPLWEQRHFGCPEPDPGNRNCVLRRRLLHRSREGRYTPGRHSNGVSAVADPPLFLFWYGWCPLELKKQRNRSTSPLVPESHLKRGWGTHHTLSDDEITEAWRTKYLPRCHDLLNGEYPDLYRAIERMRSSDRVQGDTLSALDSL